MKRHARHTLGSLVLVVVLLLSAAMPVLASSPTVAAPACVPAAAVLAERMGVACSVLMELHAQGIGLGRIRKAWLLSQTLPGFQGTWRDLLNAHLDGVGWGEIRMAHRLASALGADPDDLLALKQGGMGWGQIRRAYALAGAGIGVKLEDAIKWIREGLGWEEIRERLNLEPGPPPWSGGWRKAGAERQEREDKEDGPRDGVGRDKEDRSSGRGRSDEAPGRGRGGR